MFHMAIFFSGLEAKGNRLENVDSLRERLKIYCFFFRKLKKYITGGTSSQRTPWELRKMVVYFGVQPLFVFIKNMLIVAYKFATKSKYLNDTNQTEKETNGAWYRSSFVIFKNNKWVLYTSFVSHWLTARCRDSL